VHLREDRRHVQDADVLLLRDSITTKLNFEMAATSEMIAFALALKPVMVMLVPEGRLEVTTEGGLDLVGGHSELREAVAQLKEGGFGVSAFIDPDLKQVAAAAACGIDVCEVHTGPYAHAVHEGGGAFDHPSVVAALEAVRTTGEAIRALGMRFNAGHALHAENVQPIAALEGIGELHIGHSIVSRAVFVGLAEAVREMRGLIDEA
jgi:pyridoxine 5-phosphate synthase